MAFPASPFYHDGDFSSPTRISRTPFECPFRRHGDTTTRVYDATYVVSIDSFVPAAAGSVDPENSGYYLLSETRPEIFQGKLATFRRTYGNVPGDQITYGTQVITKPVFPTSDYLTYWVDSLVNTTQANVWSPAIESTSVGRYITGGTFTITYKTSTTAALAWNETAANIATAVNALADVVTDSMTLSCTYNALSTTGAIAFTRSAGSQSLTNLSLNLGSLTPAAVQTSTKIDASAVFYVARAAVNIQKVGHGLTTGANVRYGSGTTGGGTAAAITRVDADNFTIATVTASNPPNPIYYRTLVRTYTPGSDRVGVKRTQKFYLPGVTGGISTPEDIPIPATLINDADLLSAVVANATGYQNYDATELQFWNESSIYTQTYVAIDMADL